MGLSGQPTLDAADFIIVFVTVPDAELATHMAKTLVGEKLVACVNIVPNLRSIYAWEGNVCDEDELLCVLKTRRDLFDDLRERVLDLHPYQVPEIIALPLALGSQPYFAWLAAETRTPSR
jgi:periplasmic divalent cation tolerance protein